MLIKPKIRRRNLGSYIRIAQTERSCYQVACFIRKGAFYLTLGVFFWFFFFVVEVIFSGILQYGILFHFVLMQQYLYFGYWLDNTIKGSEEA